MSITTYINASIILQLLIFAIPLLILWIRTAARNVEKIRELDPLPSAFCSVCLRVVLLH